MKKIILFIVSLCGLLTATQAQHVYQIRADSVRIYNVCDTAELIIENRTRGISGYLYNKGNGRTEFRKIDLIQVGGSKLAIAGQDTIDLAQMSGVGGVDTIYRAGDNIRYVKQGVMREVFAPLAPADTALTLQRVTDRGNVSTRDYENLILKRATAGKGNMIIRFRNSDNSDRGYIGYGHSTDNMFLIHTADSSPTRITSRLLVNTAVDDNGSGLQVGGNVKVAGRYYQIPVSSNPESNNTYQFWNALGGANLTEDPEFRSGNNGLAIYNNIEGSTAVTITRTNDTLTERVPNTSGYYLRITTVDPTSSNVMPALGGVRFQYRTKENAVYVTRFRALIPVGYHIFANHNNFGANATSTWLTSSAGTGKWEDYVHMYIAGSSAAGSEFSTVAFYSLVGPMQTTTWYMAYYDFKISTGVSWTDNVKQDVATGRPMALWLASDSTKLSKGDQASLRVTTPYGFLDVGPQNATHMHFATDRQNFVFTKPVVATDKLAIYKNGPVTSSTTYLAQTEGRIDNSPILTQANAGGNFILKQVDTAQTGNLWMKGLLKTDQAFVSKPALGTAGFRLHNAADQLRFGMGLATAETSPNLGSDFVLWRYSDAGVANIAMTINRANGHIWMPGTVVLGNNSRIMGDNTGNVFSSWLGFYNNSYSNRYGYVGKGISNSNDILVYSDSARVVLGAKGNYALTIADVSAYFNVEDVYLADSTRNTLHFSARASSVAPPSLVTRSAGTKIVLYPNVNATLADNAIGVESGAVWHSVSSSSGVFKWYGGITNIASLTGTGNMTLSGTSTATAFYQSSLRSLKKNIQPFAGSALGILGKASIRTFQFKADSTGHQSIGFIADEVPDEIATPGRNGVDQANVVGLLVKAIQELKAEKDAMESRLKAEKAEVEARHAALEARLKAIEALLQSTKKE